MSQPFLGEIRAFPFTFAPKNWAFCDGQLLPLSQNTALFSLLGTNYGGDGKSTFALPDLRGATPVHPTSYSYPAPGVTTYIAPGDSGGTETVVLLESELPAHRHAITASSAIGDSVSPDTRTWASPQRYGRAQPPLYAPAGSGVTGTDGAALLPTGSSSAHNNMPPYLVLNYCISLTGVYPQRP